MSMHLQVSRDYSVPWDYDRPKQGESQGRERTGKPRGRAGSQLLRQSRSEGSRRCWPRHTRLHAQLRQSSALLLPRTTLARL